MTWFQAKLYCESRAARLPTEVEWEYAARGPDGLAYPWGNDFDISHVNGADEIGQTTEVGKYAEGASWVGALDMSGNVWEWVNSKYWNYPYTTLNGREQDTGDEGRVLRGGSFNYDADSLRTAFRFGDNPTRVGSNIGFRCVR
ncbi:MAG: formylglycine-generating enzyme family protein [Deinococcales bacterium]